MEFCHSFLPFIVADEARWNQTNYSTFNKIFNCTLSAEIILDVLITKLILLMIPVSDKLNVLELF